MSRALFSRADLIDSALMPPTFESRLEPQSENFVGEPEGDDAPAYREDVRVVVLTREARREEIVAECGTNTRHFVRRDLFTLTTAACDDAAIGVALGHGIRDRYANRGVVDRFFAVCAVIVHAVAESLKRVLQMLFEEKAGVIGADSDPHRR
jgi:hypothetical protein